MCFLQLQWAAAYSSSWCAGFWSQRLLLLQSTGPRCLVSSSCSTQSPKLWCTLLVAPWHVGSSWTREWTLVSCIGRWILHHWTTREVPSPPFLQYTTVSHTREFVFFFFGGILFLSFHWNISSMRVGIFICLISSLWLRATVEQINWYLAFVDLLHMETGLSFYSIQARCFWFKSRSCCILHMFSEKSLSLSVP